MEGEVMNGQTRIGLLTWVGLSILLFSCGFDRLRAAAEAAESGVQRGGTYRRVLINNPPTLDPALMTDVFSRAVVYQMFDGLVQFDVRLNPIPSIAEFWKASQDRRTWTFYLRHGVKFHHGREVTADDFVYSFTRLLKAAKPGPLTELLRRIQGAKEVSLGTIEGLHGLQAVDRYTLQITLDEPFAPLLAALGLGNAAVVPREIVEQEGAQFARAPVGAGPFKFVRWEPDKEIVLQANEQYYEGRPVLDTVVFKIGRTFEESFADFLQGDLEEALIPSGKLEEVRTNPQYQKYQRVRKPTLSILYLGFNTQDKPFNDKRVRQAFNYAVNKEAILRDITRMEGLPATGALPSGMRGHNPDLRGYDYDPAKAKRLLAEAGYPDGAGLPPVHIWTASKAESTKVELAAYQRYLAEIGVQTEIRYESDWPMFLKMLEAGKAHMFRLSWASRIPDPDDSLWHLFHSKSQRVSNFMFYDNPSVDKLLEQARQELDYAQRIALYREVESIILDDAPWIAQYYHVFQHLYQPYVQGMEVSLLGDWAVPLKKIWLKKPLVEGSMGTVPDAQSRQ
jgi:peptide/nickel transport system substrate-binding protein/oligopeptide transport system substrate-binding protein